MMVTASGETLLLARDLVDELHLRIRAEALLGTWIEWTCEGAPCPRG